jgi:hypothetical protein
MELTLHEAEKVRRGRLLEAFKAFEDWDCDTLVEQTRLLETSLGINYIQASDILFDALWLARQVRDAD